MFLKLDFKSGTPIYLQIMDQLKLQIASGKLSIGDRCPTVRRMATELRINPNTVAKAYRELEREGILEGRPGQGSFVTGGDAGLSQTRKEERVSRLMEPPVVEAYHLKMEPVDIRNILEETLRRIFGETPKQKKGGSR